MGASSMDVINLYLAVSFALRQAFGLRSSTAAVRGERVLVTRWQVYLSAYFSASGHTYISRSVRVANRSRPLPARIYGAGAMLSLNRRRSRLGGMGVARQAQDADRVQRVILHGMRWAFGYLF